ncbi:MAG: DUF952 domain-containing protein [Acidimicrobiia bacterium]
MTVLIYHIAEPDLWDAEAETYAAESLTSEGFIHCSTETQLRGVAEAFYEGRTDVIVLTIDVARLEKPPVFEDLYDHGAGFPHIYGPIPTSAVTSTRSIDEALG